MALRLGLRMIALVLEHRLRSWGNPGQFGSAADELESIDLLAEPEEEDKPQADSR